MNETPEYLNNPPPKKFKFDPNPNVNNVLIAKFIGNWKKQKTQAKWENKFLNQYSSFLNTGSRQT
eukprot:UN11570